MCNMPAKTWSLQLRILHFLIDFNNMVPILTSFIHSVVVISEYF